MSTARVSILLAALTIPALARADAPGDAILADVDTAMNRAKSHYFEYEASTTEPGHSEKKIGLTVWLKGDKRLTEFTAPADLKGTRVLVLSSTEMYAYLPAFGKVRRIASHTNDQSAFGMVFSQDDLATTRYGGDYSATVGGTDEPVLKLTLKPKPDKKPSYGKLEMLVAKDTKLPAEIRYFGENGTLLKTETRTGYTCEGDICVPGELKMVDHTKNGMWTTIARKKWKLNESFSDDLLSKRNLER